MSVFDISANSKVLRQLLMPAVKKGAGELEAEQN